MNIEQTPNLQYPNLKHHFSSRDFGFVCDSSRNEYMSRPSVYAVVSEEISVANKDKIEFRSLFALKMLSPML